MMRLLHTLPVAALAAFGLAAPALAAGQGGRGVAAWIEMSRPADALAQGKIVVERQGERVTFPSPLPYGAAQLYGGDIIKIEDADASLRLCVEEGCASVTAKEAGGRGYLVKARERSNVWDNFSALLGELASRGVQVASASTRGVGQAKYPAIYPADPKVAFKLAAGSRALHLSWMGGEAPFRVQLLDGERVLGAADAPQARSATLPEVRFAPGKYELSIKAKEGLAPGVEPLRGNANVEDLTVVAPDALPPVPQALAEVSLPQEARQLLYAQWLVYQEGGAWLLEAQQIAAALAASYPPARIWLQQWSREQGR